MERIGSTRCVPETRGIRALCCNLTLFISRRVLILDEDRIILQSLAQFLGREGYDVRVSDSPSDAAGQMETGLIDLLLADVNMPGIKPAEFLTRRSAAIPACGHLSLSPATGPSRGRLKPPKWGRSIISPSRSSMTKSAWSSKKRLASNRFYSKTKRSSISSICASAWRISLGMITRC